MATVDLVMPKMGESIMEATILKWLKNAGDPVQMDETLLEIATDKVDSEVPSTAEGVLSEVLFQVNDVVPIGTVIARTKTGAQEAQPSPPQTQPSPQASFQPRPQEAASVSHLNGNRFYSPLVLNIAAQEGGSMTELERIEGSGNEGRVTKKDILDYVRNRHTAKTGTPAPAPQAQDQQMMIPMRQVESHAPEKNSAASYSVHVDLIEWDRMRRLIPDHMVRSKHTSPHVTSFTEADVTNMVLWRDRVKKEFEKREGTKITFTPLFIEAIVRCIKKFPLINSSLDGHTIVVKKDINIGMATALPSGNLIVPVIKNADQLNLVGLARQVNQMADHARNNKLKPEDIADGTFTLTN